MPLQTQPPTTHSLSGSFPPSTAGQSAMPSSHLHVLYGCKCWCPFQQEKTFFPQVAPSKLKSSYERKQEMLLSRWSKPMANCSPRNELQGCWRNSAPRTYHSIVRLFQSSLSYARSIKCIDCHVLKQTVSKHLPPPYFHEKAELGGTLQSLR